MYVFINQHQAVESTPAPAEISTTPQIKEPPVNPNVIFLFLLKKTVQMIASDCKLF